MAARFAIDWINYAPIVITTGATSANAQIVDTPSALSGAPNSTFLPQDKGFYWYMVVSGTPAYINWGATNAVAATSANILHPIGRDDIPKALPRLPGGNNGYWVAALALSGGSGQVAFIRGYAIGS